MEVLPKEGRQMLKFKKEGKSDISPTLIFCLWLISATVLLIRGRNQSPCDINIYLGCCMY